MPQIQESGSLASSWGREASRVIAARIGAEEISKTSNEFRFKGKHVTIRCAKKATTIVGVTYSMLDRIEGVIGAFENIDGTFSLFEITPNDFKANMRDSKGENKVGLVRKKIFQEKGKRISA